MATARLPPKFVETARTRLAKARKDMGPWRQEARAAYAFVSGDQWLESDKTLLTAQKRPPVTFNYSEKMIDAVVGAEVGNRQEVTYAPREMGDDGTAELLTQVAKWDRDQVDAEDQDSDAFRDMLISGLGWTETRMNYERDPDGLIDIERIDPLEMLYDTAASKRGLADRRWQAREWWVDERDARTEWPSLIGIGDASQTAGGIDHITQGQRYRDDDAHDDSELHKDQVLIIHYQCVEREAFYRVADSEAIHNLNASDFSALRPTLDRLGIQYVKQYRLVYYRAFFEGDTLLEGGLSPCQEGFTFQPITGKRDRNKNMWYGITRVMIDPQRWANKWLSQIMHIINVNAKGGLMAETGAFADPRRAQEEWAQPDSITLLSEGGINKIQPKAPAPYPSGLDRLMEFALSSLPQVTGINLEALGLAAREQANVLEQSRKQAAFGLLSPLFDALRAYRKAQGRIFLFFIRNFLSDGRIIRISGPTGQAAIPLLRVPDAATYDVIVDQSPNAPDVKQKTWETLVQILPGMMKAGLPIPPALLDFTPLPTNLAKEWKAYIDQRSQGPSPEQMQQMQQQMQQLQQDNQRLQQQVRDKSGDLQLRQQEAEAEIQLERAKATAELELERLKIVNEIELDQMRLANENQLGHTRLAADAQIRREGITNDFQLKSQQASREDEAANASPVADALAKITEALAASQQQVADAVSDLAEAVSRPKVAHMPDGRTITVSGDKS